MIDNPKPEPRDIWESGAAYEAYVGRWSHLVALAFIQWLNAPTGSRWLDVGCGSGALSQTILKVGDPAAIKGVDRSAGFIDFAREQVTDRRVQFEVGDALALPVETGAYDVAVAGLMVNFIPQPGQAIAEMMRAIRSGGIVAAYVWDYAGKMEMLRHFWDAASALDPDDRNLDEGRRFPICQPGPLATLFQGGGLKDVEVRPIDVATVFRDFEDFWLPFLGGQGPAASYAMSLSEEKRAALRERIRAGLPFAVDGSIPLMARAWAVRGLRY